MLKAATVIDNLLNAITMYRLMLYGLLFLMGIAIVFGFLRLLPFSGLSLIISAVTLLTAGFVTNTAFSKVFNAVTNHESGLITSLILFFVMLPPQNSHEVLIIASAAVLALGSKFLFAPGKKHIFNPVAFGAVVLGLANLGFAIWWVGSMVMLPFVLILGLLVVRKIRRFRMFLTFAASALLAMLFFGFTNKVPPLEVLSVALFSYPVIFFGSIMFTEPQTTPPTKNLQMIYGVIVGVIFGSQFHIGPFAPTPEFALVVGNIFSYLVSSRKLFLKFEQKKEIARDTYEFIFSDTNSFTFTPGQYFEWTLPRVPLDSRGNRRFFTIASSPTENRIKIGVRIYPSPSSFKRTLLELHPGNIIIASQLSGDFVLPEDSNQKLVFVAGGIGITPFVAIIKYLLDKGEKREIVLFYANKTADEIAYGDLLSRAEKELNAKAVYLIDKDATAPNFKCEFGRLSEEIIKKHVPDYHERLFYLSGPNAMVNAYKELLAIMGIKGGQVVTDYFPGY